MFQLTSPEWTNLISQFATSRSTSGNANWGGRRKLPYVLTEHGAVMLASVLNSKVAVAASIQVVRAFLKLREVLDSHKALALKFDLLAEKFGRHDKEIQTLFHAIRELMQPVTPPRKRIGYKSGRGACAYTKSICGNLRHLREILPKSPRKFR